MKNDALTGQLYFFNGELLGIAGIGTKQAEQT
jgi:hypothetical protein